MIDGFTLPDLKCDFLGTHMDPPGVPILSVPRLGSILLKTKSSSGLAGELFTALIESNPSRGTAFGLTGSSQPLRPTGFGGCPVNNRANDPNVNGLEALKRFLDFRQPAHVASR